MGRYRAIYQTYPRAQKALEELKRSMEEVMKYWFVKPMRLHEVAWWCDLVILYTEAIPGCAFPIQLCLGKSRTAIRFASEPSEDIQVEWNLVNMDEDCRDDLRIAAALLVECQRLGFNTVVVDGHGGYREEENEVYFGVEQVNVRNFLHWMWKKFGEQASQKQRESGFIVVY